MPRQEVGAVTYTVVFHLDPSGWWFAEVPDLPGCHTQGRTVDQARARIREAISAWLDVSEESVAIRDDIRYQDAG